MPDADAFPQSRKFLEKVARMFRSTGDITRFFNHCTVTSIVPGGQSVVTQPFKGGKEDSCNLTCNMILEIASMQPAKVVQGLGGMDAGKKIKAIDKLLDGPNVVGISVNNKDHHFCVVAYSKTDICLLQGFQDSYSLADWLNHCGLGFMKRERFLGALKDLLTETGTKRVDAAVLLFSFNNFNSKAADQVVRDQKQLDIQAWFTPGFTSNVVMLKYKAL